MRLVALSSAVRARGQHVSQVFEIPADALIATVRVPRRGWQADDTLGCRLEFSGDAVRWTGQASFTTQGGDYITRRGELLVENVMRPTIPPGARFGRIVVDCKNAMTVGVDVEFE